MHNGVCLCAKAGLLLRWPITERWYLAALVSLMGGLVPIRPSTEQPEVLPLSRRDIGSFHALRWQKVAGGRLCVLLRPLLALNNQSPPGLCVPSLFPFPFLSITGSLLSYISLQVIPYTAPALGLTLLISARLTSPTLIPFDSSSWKRSFFGKDLDGTIYARKIASDKHHQHKTTR